METALPRLGVVRRLRPFHSKFISFKTSLVHPFQVRVFYTVTLILRLTFGLVPKDTSCVSSASSVDGCYKVALRDVAPRDLYKQLKKERKVGDTHTLTTAELTRLVDAAAQYKYPETDDFTEAVNAAEAAKQRQNKILEDRVKLLERLDIAQTPIPTAVIPKRKVPLDDFKRTTVDDRRQILAAKLQATLKRLRGLDEVETDDDDLHDRKVKFRLGFRRLRALDEHLDWVTDKFIEEDWKSVNWGLTAIGGVSFKQIRSNYRNILRTVADICDTYFSCLDIESLV